MTSGWRGRSAEREEAGRGHRRRPVATLGSPGDPPHASPVGRWPGRWPGPWGMRTRHTNLLVLSSSLPVLRVGALSPS